MPTLRTAASIRDDLEDVTTRSADLAQREREATTELATAQARHGELYANGADASTIKRQAVAVGALQTELSGIAGGRSLLAQQSEMLTRELSAADAREALAKDTDAHDTATAALTAWTAHVNDVLFSESDFARLYAEVHEAVTRAREAAADAMALNRNSGPQIEARYAYLWQAFPGLATFFNAVDQYRRTALPSSSSAE